MTTYNTGNPIGSANPKDLYDNSQNLDKAVNSQESTWEDRFGVVRPTLKSAVDPTGLVQEAVGAAERAEEAADIAEHIAAMGTYLTKTEADAALPKPKGTVIRVTNDPDPANNGYWVSDGSQWIWSGFQPSDYRFWTVANNAALSTLLKMGMYGSAAENDHPDLPSSFPVGVGKVIRVERQLDAGVSSYVTQYLYQTDRPQFQWTRRVLSSGATTSWVMPFDQSITGVVNANAKQLLRPGTYVLTGTPSELPSDWPSGATPLAKVEQHGGFLVTTLFTTSNEALRWQSIGGGNWSIIKGFGLTAPSNFTRNYAYRGLVAQGNADDLHDEGHYMLTQPATGLPADVPSETALVDVEVYGSFAVQTVRYRNQMRSVWQRSGTITSAGVATWQTYQKVGGGDNPLAGAVIAVIGDSIVESGNWPEQLASATGAIVHKFGFGGCRMSAYPTSVGRYDGMCGYAIATCIGSGDFTYLLDCAEAVAQPPTSDDNRPQAAALASLDWSTVDILVIAFGTNDWTRSDLDLGTGYGADPTGMTLRGSVAHIIQSIQVAYPNIRIVFQLPSYRTFGGGPNADEDAWIARTNSIALTDVNDAIADVAQRAGCPSMDMLRDGTVNAYTAEHYLRDGIHPRPGLGFALWAKRIAGWLRSIA